MAEVEAKDRIEQRLEELPQDVKDAVLSADLGAHLREIGAKHNLHVDQIGKLEDETMLVMLGFFDPEAFHTQLQEQLALQPEEATAIANEVSAAVFMPIRESLKRFTESKKAPPATPISENLPVVAPRIVPISVPPISSVASVMPTAEKILSEPTALTVPTPPPAAPNSALTPAQPQTSAPQPKIYKADPYREPIE